jgi:hypothetical protein
MEALPVRILLGILVSCLITSCADAKSKQIIGKTVVLPNNRVGLIAGRSEGGYIIVQRQPGVASSSLLKNPWP